MITDEEAKKAVGDVMASLKKIDEYCKDHDCADCQFHGEYDELTEEYVCDIGQHLGARWHR